MMISSLSDEKEFNKNSGDYRKTKHQLALDHLKLANKNKQKSLCTFQPLKI